MITAKEIKDRASEAYSKHYALLQCRFRAGELLSDWLIEDGYGIAYEVARQAWADHCDTMLKEEQASKGIL